MAEPRGALLCSVEPVGFKHVPDEIRAHKDLRALSRHASAALDVRSGDARAVVDAALAALTAAGSLPAHAVPGARAALLGRAAGAAAGAGELPTSVVEGEGGHWRQAIHGQGVVVPFAKVGALDGGEERAVAVVRLATPCRMGPGGGLTQFVAVVLSPAKEIKDLKGGFELGRSVASMFQDEVFYEEAKAAAYEGELRAAIARFLDREVGDQEVTQRGSFVRRRLRRRAPRGGGSSGSDEPGSSTPEEESPAESDLEKEEARAVDDVDPFARTGRFAGGLVDDIKRRYRWSVYRSDWTDGLRDGRSLLKYVSTIVWLYFAIIMPTIAFGALDDKNTSGQIGVIETLVSQAFAGLAFAALAGQPLTIVMTTAPLTVFIDVLFSWSTSLEIPFLPFYAWTGIWTAIILLILVVTDSCFVMKYCGHFTEEIFAMLIAALFVAEYIKELIHVAEDEPTDVFLLAFVLATGTYLIANWLLVFKRSFLLKPIIRLLLSDFGVPIAILIMSGVRQAFSSVDAEMLAVPDEIGVVTTSGRSWLVPIFDLDIKFIMLALVSGILLSTLFFLDQNISSILVNRKENKLRKGTGYYMDLVVVAVIIAVQSIFGMPWTHAALPHSPLHARQLADVEEYEAHGRQYERVVKSRETRLTGFVTHLLIFLSILAKDALGQIPLAVLYGFFLYMGFATLDGNAMWDRILLLFTQKERYPANHYVRRVPISKIHAYTLIQVLLLIVLWFFKSNFYLGDTVFNTGLLFPFVIAMFIPVRLYVLPRIFTPTQLAALSHEEATDISDSGITV